MADEHDPSLEDYVESLIKPWTERMVAGDVTLREYVEQTMELTRESVAALKAMQV